MGETRQARGASPPLPKPNPVTPPAGLFSAGSGWNSARGGTTTVLALHPDHPQGQVGFRGLLAGRGKERALRGRRAAALLCHLEPALHRLGPLEQRLDLVELLARERTHRLAKTVGPVDTLDQLL